uniref:Uncharacterized protein n=1 Tax=Octopus bimaculoides TaxID=37653 RepID=A0A0L8IC77_OCTBM
MKYNSQMAANFRYEGICYFIPKKEGSFGLLDIIYKYLNNSCLHPFTFHKKKNIHEKILINRKYKKFLIVFFLCIILLFVSFEILLYIGVCKTQLLHGMIR